MKNINEKKAMELNDNELEKVTGGAQTPQDVEELDGYTIGMNVVIAARYFGDSYGGGGSNTKLVNSDAVIGRIISGRPAPYRLDVGGTWIGWGDLTTLGH